MSPLVEVAVPRPVRGGFHYSVPAHLAGRARIGARVLVPFGKMKLTGVVVRAGAEAPDGVAPVDLSEVLDDEPSLPVDLVELCLWIADYYEAPVGEVTRGALPAGSGVAAKRVLAVTDAGRAAAAGDGAALPPKHRELLARLLEGPRPAIGAIRKTAEALLARGLVEELEERAARVKLRRERVVELAVDLAVAREAVAHAPRRLAVIEALAAEVEATSAAGPAAVSARDLARTIHGAAEAIRELSRAGLVRVFEREAALEAALTGDEVASLAAPPPQLTAEQQVAVDAIVAAIPGIEPRPEAAAAFTPFLLHGVTGSGKTEVYLRVIARALAAGKTALVLVPEISLTPQLAARFRARFGDEVAILHSGMSDQQRLNEWSRLRRREARIAVGARSAVFAPLEQLGVIVVDEEHDGSFKQEEGVRYHARDVALVRAQRAGAACVLGSATPSMESYAHAERGAYRRLALTERPTHRPMPAVEVVDLRTHVPDGEAMLSAKLRAAVAETLAAGDQTILFLNRRGFATFVLCRACGHSFGCKSCAVSLTYHRSGDRLICHYCNSTERVPAICPECSGKDTIVRKGLGTEKVAESVAQAFPQARVARLDRDVASGAKVEGVLARVARREVDILVGTQMVTKGHDFPGVTLVGVLCADTGLHVPDFRASERTFQLLAQVAGRAGRGDRPGRVIVQTYRPGAHAVTCAAAHDYASFFVAESAARAELGYPPHGRLVAIRIDGSKPLEVERTAMRIAQLADQAARTLSPEEHVELRGPVPAPLERLRGRTRWQIWLRGADRHALRRIARLALGVEVASGVRVVLDVDPISVL